MILEQNWHIVEDNTKESFRLCKNDIINFGVQLAKVQQSQRQLAEDVGALKAQPDCDHGSVDFSGVYARTDALAREVTELRATRLEPSPLEHDVKGVEEQLADLRKRYEHLVGITKELVAVVEHKLKQPSINKVVKVIKAKPKIVRKIIRIKSKPTIIRKIIRIHSRPKIIKIAAKRSYIASKATLRVHDKHCPFARNIKRKTKVVFKSRMTAFKRGYRACKCLK